MMWLYEGHMGELFLSDEPLSYDECYCEVCGDSDWELGSVEIAEDVLRILADDIAVQPEEGGWDMNYIMEFLRENFNVVPTEEAAKQWILSCRTKEPVEE